MKILVFGADGFVGRNVVIELSKYHEVFEATRKSDNKNKTYSVDLLDKSSIIRILDNIKPNVIINNAGIVENTEASINNLVFTQNILESVAECGLHLEKVIISGSAAEYGLVEERNIPLKEDAPLNAAAGYGLSKLKETMFALNYADKHNINIVVARIFNPIGAGMHSRFLIPKIISQVKDIKSGNSKVIEVSRLDSRRDYIDIRDVACAFRLLVENHTSFKVYNIGSGKSTSNGQLIEIILKNSKISTKPELVETSDHAEPLVAVQADISRIYEEFGWIPVVKLEETIKDIINATR